ncbi:MAG: hypothetical protein NTV89_17895 [Proteobacteria bacterium]|nr:hypothetical protein [Pseudomonadota bacterium]
MARMIPATFSFQPESKAEERLFYALRDSLDDTHIIFHSFDLFKRNLDIRWICEAPRHFPRATRHASAVIARRESAAAISTNNC